MRPFVSSLEILLDSDEKRALWFSCCGKKNTPEYKLTFALYSMFQNRIDVIFVKGLTIFVSFFFVVV